MLFPVVRSCRRVRPAGWSGSIRVPPRAAGGAEVPDEMMSAPNLLLNVNGIEVIYNHVALVLKTIDQLPTQPTMATDSKAR